MKCHSLSTTDRSDTRFILFGGMSTAGSEPEPSKDGLLFHHQNGHRIGLYDLEPTYIGCAAVNPAHSTRL